MMLRHPSPTLSRAAALTDLVREAAPIPERLDGSLRRALAYRLSASAPAREHGSVRLDGWTVEQALLPVMNSQDAFVWSPRTSRRLLGLAAARRVLTGTSPNPMAGVLAEIDAIALRATTQDLRPGSLGAWLTEAPRGVLGAIVAEATTYATDVVTLLDWDRLETPTAVGAADPVWAVPGAPWVSLRGRRDIEITLDADAGTRALICLRAGRPSEASMEDLSLVALASGLTKPDAPLPTRIVGVWPTAGRSVSLEISAHDIRRSARRLVDAASALRQETAHATAA